MKRNLTTFKNSKFGLGIQNPEQPPHIDYLSAKYLQDAKKLQAVIEALTERRFGDISKNGAPFPFGLLQVFV